MKLVAGERGDRDGGGGEGAYRWPTVPVAPRMPTLIWGRAGADMRVL